MAHSGPSSEQRRTVLQTAIIVCVLLMIAAIHKGREELVDGEAIYTLDAAESSRVHCICGPGTVVTPNHGCQVVFENAVTKVIADKRVEVHLFAASRDEYKALALTALKCVGWGSQQQRLHFDWDQFHMGRASDDMRRTCNERTWRKELQWSVKWPFAVFYHFMYDRGVFQAWMFLRELERYLGVSQLPPLIVNVMDRSDWVKRHLTPAEEEIWDLMVPSERRSVLTNETYCSRYSTFGYFWISPMTYRTDFVLPVALKGSLRAFSAQLQERIIAVHGDVPVDDKAVMFVPRLVHAYFDDQNRSRGIQPVLEQKIRRTFLEVLGANGRVDTVDVEKLPTLKTQFHAIRRHRYLYSAEGSFFTSIVLAPPRSTWLIVYNHTRRPDVWKHHNFHATIANSLPGMRLIVFVIDSGVEPAQAELRRHLEAPWKRGVYFIGADADGNRAAAGMISPASVSNRKPARNSLK